MASIQEVRQKYPQYADLSDQQLAEGLHKKYYSDLPFEDFSQRIGLQTQLAQPTEQPTPRTDWLRRIALGGRAIGEGVVGTLAALPNARASLENSIGSLFGLPAQPTPSDELTALLDRFGAYKPETGGEKLGYEAIRGGAGALAGAGPAGLIKNAAALGSVAASGGLGGAAPEAVRQAGGGPVAQTAAGIGASLLPSGSRAGIASVAKRTVRGGEAGRLKVAENIKTFEDAGAMPSMGQATQNRRMQSAESLLSRAPGGAGVMARRAETQAQDIGAGIERQAASLAPKSSAEQAGRAISRGVTGEGGFTDQFKAKQRELYSAVDRHISGDTFVDVKATKGALADLNADIPGAPAISQWFKNARIKGIEGAMKSDTEGGAVVASRPELGAAFRDMFEKLKPAEKEYWLSRLRDDKLPYEAVKKLRTLVGREMEEGGLLSDVPRSKWKALYGALSADMENAAKASGPQATAAWTRANNYTRAGMRRLEAIDHVIDKNGGPEAIFQAAISGNKEGATTLRAVMKSVPPDAQKMMTATVLRRLGRAKAGQQNDLGETFSAETFLTNWNSMSNEAKATLFNRYGPSFRQDMDQIAKVADNLRQGSKVFRNPSGTAQASIQYGTVGAFLGAAFTGNLGTAALIAGGAGGANLFSRLFTNPRAVKWLAVHAKAPISALPALANQLTRSNDPDLQELGQALQQRPDQ